MKIEAIVTCVQYSDFLAETLPHNRTLFDRMIVVTAPEDKETRALCEHWNVECLPTDSFNSRWDQFCKGAAINDGLAKLDKSDWIVHLDADILLPPLTRGLLEDAALDPSFIYGIDRVMVTDYVKWRKFLSKPVSQLAGGAFLRVEEFLRGDRLVTRQFGGWVPIGFFQMWHGSSGRLTYPTEHTSAARGDVQFATQWPRTKRALIPEIIGYHIESEVVEMGTNWLGRKTKPFLPALKKDSDYDIK